MFITAKIALSYSRDSTVQHWEWSKPDWKERMVRWNGYKNFLVSRSSFVRTIQYCSIEGCHSLFCQVFEISEFSKTWYLGGPLQLAWIFSFWLTFLFPPQEILIFIQGFLAWSVFVLILNEQNCQWTRCLLKGFILIRFSNSLSCNSSVRRD